MDASLTAGLPMTILGVGTVFTALVALIAAIGVISRLTGRSPGLGASGAAPAGPSPTAAPLHDPAAVAAAAYSPHVALGRRVADPDPASSWKLAGRLRAMARLSG